MIKSKDTITPIQIVGANFSIKDLEKCFTDKDGNSLMIID